MPHSFVKINKVAWYRDKRQKLPSSYTLWMIENTGIRKELKGDPPHN